MRIVLVTLALTLLCCNPPEGKLKEKKATMDDGSTVVSTKYPNGKKKAEATYKDGKRNGPSRSFDTDGNLSLELMYVDDKKDGQSSKFYQGGKQVYQTTEYKDNMLHGKRIKYRQNGNLMSEARFEKDFPCLGLKEYLLDNSLKKKYPKIVITPIDRLDTEGIYLLEIAMSEKVRSVKYYSGKLSSEGCLHGDLYSILRDDTRHTGQLKYFMSPGGFLMEELTIIAEVETIMGNSYVTERTYNLAIDN